MNDEQIRTQEFIFRDRRDAEGEGDAKGSKKTRSGIILGSAAVVIAAAVIILFAAGKLKKQDSLTITDDNGTVAENVIEDADETANETSKTGNSRKEAKPIPVALTEETDLSGSEDRDAGGEEFPLAFEDNETIGLSTSGIDIYDIYRADDPALPSYLTRTTNEKFRMNLSTDELNLLMRLVEAEAPAEDIFGRILVANVVLNRVLTEGWASTVTGVIYEKSGNAVQFSSTAIPYYWNSIVVSDLTREAVMRALSGEDYSNGAVFFFAWKKHPELTPTTGWISAYQYLFIHGGHAFYK